MVTTDRFYAEAQLAGKPVVGADGEPVFTFRITSEAVDRQGEIVLSDGWDFASYLRNPVVLNSHQYNDISSIVGRTMSISRDDGGWTADVRFNATAGGKLARQLVEGGDLRAVSVGFRPIAVDYPHGSSMQLTPAGGGRRLRGIEDGEDVGAKALVTMNVQPEQAVRHVQKELLEISVVPIPANAQSVRLRSFGAAAVTGDTEPPRVEDTGEESHGPPRWMQANARRGLRWAAARGAPESAERIARAILRGGVGATAVREIAQRSSALAPSLHGGAAVPDQPGYPSSAVVEAALLGGGTAHQTERAIAWAEAVIERRGAIPPHRTPVNSNRGAEWDGGAVAFQSDTDTLRRVSAWYDEENPDVKSSYKLAHHEPEPPYRVNWRGLTAAMAALNGARSPLDVPSDDREAIYRHLAAHYEQFEATAPALRAVDAMIEKQMPNDSSDDLARALGAALAAATSDDTDRGAPYGAVRRAVSGSDAAAIRNAVQMLLNVLQPGGQGAEEQHSENDEGAEEGETAKPTPPATGRRRRGRPMGAPAVAAAEANMRGARTKAAAAPDTDDPRVLVDVDSLAEAFARAIEIYNELREEEAAEGGYGEDSDGEAAAAPELDALTLIEGIGEWLENTR